MKEARDETVLSADELRDAKDLRRARGRDGAGEIAPDKWSRSGHNASEDAEYVSLTC